jgi:hypothetical protein
LAGIVDFFGFIEIKLAALLLDFLRLSVNICLARIKIEITGTFSHLIENRPGIGKHVVVCQV